MPQRYVSIWFPHLATDWFALLQPQLRGVPFVLRAPAHGRMVVTAASPQAQAQGIRAGMVLADARAMYPALQALDDRPGLTGQLLQRAAEWCIRFTPVAAPDPPDGVLLDASGCAHLWGGEEAYLTDITKRLSARGYSARAVMADTAGAAWAVARFAQAAAVVLPGRQLQALSALPPAALRLEPAAVERLHKLGLHRVADFVHMPRPTLRRRFGTHLLQRVAQALGQLPEPLVPVYPPEPWRERLPCLEPIRTRHGIEIALQRLLDALCARLRKEGKGLRAAYFRGYRVDNQARGIEISTSRASHNETHLFHLFSLKLDSLEPALGIELFQLEATRVEDCLPVQEGLWEGSRSSDATQLSELIDRLSGRLGPGVIHRYLPAEHYWPERSYKPASAFEEAPATEWKVDRPRPLQLLSPPELVEVTAPIPDYPPMLFRHRGQLHKIVRADGPERIEQEWWIQEGEHRDYYCVEDEAGQRYWLFRSGHYDAQRRHQWFLHGYFA